jgi:hypothetical protein
MTIAVPTRKSGSYGLKSRLTMCVAPVAALVYPFTLKAFNVAVTALNAGSSSAVPVAAASVSLFFSFALPALIVVTALRFAEIEAPTVAQLRAKRIAIFAVAAPTIFVFIGVLDYMAGDPVPDVGLWVVFWAAITVFVLRADNEVPASSERKPIAPALRVAHGFSALAIVVIFLGFHISNHLSGLVGPEAHIAFMKVVRHVYRAAVIEPVLVGLFFPGRLRAPLCVSLHGCPDGPIPGLPSRLGDVSRLLHHRTHGFGLHFCAHLSRNRLGLGFCDRSADRAHQGSLEHPARPALRTRRLLCTRSSRLGRACHPSFPWGAQEYRR